ncbi:MAG: flagellar basal body-associated FliL family protein [Nitrospinae bacterium]|nr:flagellar basal body-associated FliL family protein [Nitrospinota bacterium]MBI3815553.1 flagellar basal body-associated FliL family protein [Nitrospinota bacterium]
MERKTSTLKLIIIILIPLIILGAGGFIAWIKYITPAIGMVSQDVSNTTSGPMFSLEPFIVNLSEPGGKRYIKIKMEFDAGNKEVEKELKNKLPLLKDNIITVLTGKTLEEVITTEGKIRLKEEIQARINRNLRTGAVKNVFFTEFVVQ